MDNEEREAYYNEFEKEVELMKLFNHPNIMSCIDTISMDEEDGSVRIIRMDLMKSDLLRWMKGKPEQSEIKRVIKEILLGVREMHKQDVVHCDLRPSNILIDFDGHARVADFNCSMMKGKYETVGTSLWYRSPEGTLTMEYDKPSDVWSIGCIIFELETGEPLFPCKEEIVLMRQMFRRLGMSSYKPFSDFINQIYSNLFKKA